MSCKYKIGQLVRFPYLSCHIGSSQGLDKTVGLIRAFIILLAYTEEAREGYSLKSNFTVLIRRGSAVAQW